MFQLKRKKPTLLGIDISSTSVKLVELAQSYQATITISNEEKTATADSVMGLLMLESAQGQQVSVSASGNDAKAALYAVSELIEAGFDEES